jgi:hypothetical protein
MDVQFTEKTYKNSLSKDYELLLKLVKKGYQLIFFYNDYNKYYDNKFKRKMGIMDYGTFSYIGFIEKCKECDLTFINK